MRGGWGAIKVKAEISEQQRSPCGVAGDAPAHAAEQALLNGSYSLVVYLFLRSPLWGLVGENRLLEC